MSYTRRRVIRDAGLMSLAGVSGFSPFLTGCRCNTFADGIRIFFEGAWLFCAHPYDVNLLLAVTLNPITQNPTPPQIVKPGQQPPPSDKTATVKDPSQNESPDPMSHIFPYGVWD